MNRHNRRAPRLPLPRHPQPHLALAREAMATRFEIVLPGENRSSLRAAGEAALDEIERLDQQLNLYNPSSEIAHINARAAAEPVRVEPGLFRLLERAQRLHSETGGAFDITIVPLVRCWGFMGSKGKIPSRADLAAARAKVGMHLVLHDPNNRTIQFARPGVMLDLGAIGKGYAVEQAAEILREAGVSSALLHGGTSTIYALGVPPDAPAWKVALEYPPQEPRSSRCESAHYSSLEDQSRLTAAATAHALKEGIDLLISVVSLKNEALSVSAVWGKSFQSKGKTYGHIIDPRTGHPASKAALAAVALPSATETDALSTALLTVGLKGHNQIAGLRPGMRTCVMRPPKGPGPFQFQTSGMLSLMKDEDLSYPP